MALRLMSTPPSQSRVDKGFQFAMTSLLVSVTEPIRQ